MKKSRKIVLAVALTASVAAAGAVWAHGGATGIVKERMDAMEVLQDAMKVVGKMVRGQSEFDSGAVSKAAEEISNHSGEAMTKLFPEGSIKKPSEALPAIWQDWDAFNEEAEKLKLLGSELNQTAVGMNNGGSPEDIRQVGSIFLQIGKTCSSCHEKFRLKKD